MARELTEVAKCAKEIRKILKEKHPNVKFRIRSENFSMGNSITVTYFDYLPTKEVQKDIDHFQYGHFNGMEDIYESSNNRSDIPQTKYLHVTREMSDEIRDQITADLMNDGINVEDRNEWVDRYDCWVSNIPHRKFGEMILEPNNDAKKSWW